MPPLSEVHPRTMAVSDSRDKAPRVAFVSVCITYTTTSLAVFSHGRRDVQPQRLDGDMSRDGAECGLQSPWQLFSANQNIIFTVLTGYLNKMI